MAPGLQGHLTHKKTHRCAGGLGEREAELEAVVGVEEEHAHGRLFFDVYLKRPRISPDFRGRRTAYRLSGHGSQLTRVPHSQKNAPLCEQLRGARGRAGGRCRRGRRTRP